MRYSQSVCRLQDKVGQFICGVCSVRFYPSDGHVAPFGESDVLSAFCSGKLDVLRFHTFNAQLTEQIQNFFIVDFTLIHVLSVERVHVLVKSSQVCG